MKQQHVIIVSSLAFLVRFLEVEHDSNMFFLLKKTGGVTVHSLCCHLLRTQSALWNYSSKILRQGIPCRAVGWGLGED